MELFKKDNIKSSIFNITALTPINWKEILENVRETKKIIIIDDIINIDFRKLIKE